MGFVDASTYGLRVACRTATGPVRTWNEDAFLVDAAANLLVVCDGMGGNCNGCPAAKVGIWAVSEVMNKSEGSVKDPGTRLREAIGAAHERILRITPILRGAAITLVVLYLQSTAQGPELVVAHVGDVRVGAMVQDRLEPVTADHTVLGQLLAHGHEPTPMQAKMYARMTTRAVGMERHSSEIDVHTKNVTIGERLLVTSDGVHFFVDNRQLAEICHRHGSDLPAAIEEILATAIAAGCDDNLTACLVEICPRSQASESQASFSPPTPRWLYAPDGDLEDVPEHWRQLGEQPISSFREFYALVMGDD